MPNKTLAFPQLDLTELNAQQQDAVLKPRHEAVKVMAGAGTGKTKLISHRFLKLVMEMEADSIARPQDRILAVTFTQEAAKSLHEKINAQLLAQHMEGLGARSWIGNFHQLAIRILRNEIDNGMPWPLLEAGLSPKFDILDAFAQRLLFNRVWQSILAGDYPDIASILQRHALTLKADTLSAEGFARLQTLGVDLDTLDAPTLLGVINRIKTAGLSPALFYKEASQQTRRFSESIQHCPVFFDLTQDPVDVARTNLSQWHRHFSEYASNNWDPFNDVRPKKDDPTAGEYLDALSCIKERTLSYNKSSRRHEPETPQPDPLDKTTALELALVETLTAVYAVYQQALYEANACDFDDLINHAIRLLELQPELRARYQQQFEHLIVDEFQDSNASQLKLLHLLMRNEQPNITVVGDLKQSIYGFRFGQPENMELAFRKNGVELPRHEIPLQTNYRCKANIIDAANVITRQISTDDREQLQTCPRYENDREPKVTWVNLDSDTGLGDLKDTEAACIATEIHQLLKDNYEPREIAVLVKSNKKAEAIQKALNACGIPSVRKKNLGFFQEPVIKDAIALLRLMLNPHDNHALVRILQGRLNARQMKVIADSLPDETSWFSYLQACAHKEQTLDLPADISTAVFELIQTLITLRQRQARTGIAQLFLALASQVGIIQPHWPLHVKVQARNTLRQFEKLLFQICRKKPLQPTLSEIVDTLLIYQNADNPELPLAESAAGENAVQLMTIHASKGLEFKAVFLAATEDNAHGRSLPALIFDPQFEGKPGFGLMLSNFENADTTKKELYRALWNKPRENAEKQRVFYVALTRAMEKLVVVRGTQSEPWSDPSHYDPEITETFRQSDADTFNARFTKPEKTAVTAPMIQSVVRDPENKPAAASKPSPPLLHLSFSALNAFETCPALYWLKYQWRLPEPPTKEHNHDAVLTGSYLHGLIHRHYLLEGKLDAPLATELVTAWLGAEEETLSTDEQSAIITDTLTRYRAFLKSEYAFEELEKKNLRIYPERKIRFPWQNNTLIEVDGVMDLLLEDRASNTHTLIDFKTNKTLNAEKQAHYFRQLRLYRAGLQQLWPTLNLPDEHLKLVQITPEGVETFALKPAKTSQDKALEARIEAIATLAAQRRFPTRPQNVRCKGCAYLAVCPEASP